MPNPSLAFSQAEVRNTGKALSTAAVAFLAMFVAFLVLTLQPPLLERSAVGVLVCVAAIIGGDYLSRRDRHCWWFGSSVMVGGYALAYFFAAGTFYLSALPPMETPYVCWLAVLMLGAAATIHGYRNQLMRWAALPLTLGTTAAVMYLSLQSTAVVSIAGLSMNVSAVASIAAVLWWALLSAGYNHIGGLLERDTGKNTQLMYRIGHEVFFVLAAVNALALPKFVGTLENAPLWWSIETPVLLAICWRSRSFFKHALVMGIWSVSVALLLYAVNLDLSAFVRMAVPISGVVMAMCYRYIQSTWKHEQKVIGYSVYLYGSVGVALVLPLLQLGIWGALPYWMLESLVLCGLALALRDRTLQIAGWALAVVAVALFGFDWQNWNIPFLSVVVAGCYALSLLNARVRLKGGLPNSEYVPVPRPHTISVTEARYAEGVFATAGFTLMLVGTLLLLGHPKNTIAWAVEALAVIVFGFVSNKRGHRLSGLVAFGLAAGKLAIFDLSGASTQYRTLAFGAFGVCCLIAAYMYLWDLRNLGSGSKPPEGDNTTGDTDDKSNDPK